MKPIWHASYPEGVPTSIELQDLVSIGAYFDQVVARHPQRKAFISGATGVSLTYQQLQARASQLARYCQQVLQLPQGSRVAVMMPNLLQYPVCLFGLLSAGYVVVNVNPLYTPRELEHQLRDSGARAMIVAEPFATTLEQVLERTEVKHVIVSALTDLMPPLQRWIGNFLIHQVKKAVPPYRLPGHVRFMQALEEGSRHPHRACEVRPDDLAFLQYTGGTTGVSKGAMLTHRNVLANARQVLSWCRPHLTPDEEVVSITAIPLYHVFALGNCLSFAGLGGTNVLVADPRNTRQFIRILKRYPFTAIPAVNTLFNDLTRHPDFASVDFSRLKLAVGGGAAVQRPVAERWQQLTGKPLVEGYGLTECSPTVAVNPFDMTEFSGTIGLPLPSTEVSIRDEQGQELPLGAPGELCVRGPQVMSGYWMRPEETARVMTADGFLKTGDLATMDGRGFLRIVDRLKDMILVSGFNVYPNEVEEVVMMHPDVLEVAAVGVPHESSGERVQVFVVPRSPDLTEQALLAHCRQHLTGYKVPVKVTLMESLPKSNVGKILRRQLREHAQPGSAQPAR